MHPRHKTSEKNREKAQSNDAATVSVYIVPTFDYNHIHLPDPAMIHHRPFGHNKQASRERRGDMIRYLLGVYFVKTVRTN